MSALGDLITDLGRNPSTEHTNEFMLTLIRQAAQTDCLNIEPTPKDGAVRNVTLNHNTQSISLEYANGGRWWPMEQGISSHIVEAFRVLARENRLL